MQSFLIQLKLCNYLGEMVFSRLGQKNENCYSYLGIQLAVARKKCKYTPYVISQWQQSCGCEFRERSLKWVNKKCYSSNTYDEEKQAINNTHIQMQYINIENKILYTY